jgi:hypothetical protein
VGSFLAPEGISAALLAGLLSCASCKRPMNATYTAKGARRYRYYVWKAARKKGGDTCPSKSVTAAQIEDSVIVKPRMALSADGKRQQLQISNVDWQAFEEGAPAGLVRAVMEEISHNGVTDAVSLKRTSVERNNEDRIHAFRPTRACATRFQRMVSVNDICAGALRWACRTITPP